MRAGHRAKGQSDKKAQNERCVTPPTGKGHSVPVRRQNDVAATGPNAAAQPSGQARSQPRYWAKPDGIGGTQRHWYASTQLDAGESLPAVAARIGDHVEILARVYARRGHRGDHDDAENLGALIDGPD